MIEKQLNLFGEEIENKNIGWMISFRKEYFQAMIDKKKLHEFRRRFSEINSNFYSLIYISAPISAVTAIAKFKPTIIGDIEKMVKLRQTHTFSNDNNVRDYFSGLSKCYALPLVEIINLEYPVTLNELRSIIPNFMPPQNYFKVNNDKYKSMVEYIKKRNGISDETL